jgi:hypothetical protein
MSFRLKIGDVNAINYNAARQKRQNFLTPLNSYGTHLAHDMVSESYRLIIVVTVSVKASLEN